MSLRKRFWKDKRFRIHPLVAVTAIICITALAITAQAYDGTEFWKWIAISIIAWILGVKLRVKLPLT